MSDGRSRSFTPLAAFGSAVFVVLLVGCASHTAVTCDNGYGYPSNFACRGTPIDDHTMDDFCATHIGGPRYCAGYDEGVAYCVPMLGMRGRAVVCDDSGTLSLQ